MAAARLLAVVLLCAGVLLRAAEGPGTPADEKAIRGVLAAMSEAWNRQDPRAFSRLFANRMDFVTRGGVWLRNRAELEHRLTTLLQGEFKGSTSRITPQAIRFYKPDVAVVQAEGDTVRKGEASSAAPLHTLMTVVVVKQKGVWKIAAAENTEVQPGAQASSPSAGK